MILPKPSKELVGVPKRKLVGGLVQARVPVGLSRRKSLKVIGPDERVFFYFLKP